MKILNVKDKKLFCPAGHALAVKVYSDIPMVEELVCEPCYFTLVKILPHPCAWAKTYDYGREGALWECKQCAARILCPADTDPGRKYASGLSQKAKKDLLVLLRADGPDGHIFASDNELMMRSASLPLMTKLGDNK